MNQYRNLNRPGVRTSTTMNPKVALEDIDTKIRELSPEATPIQTFASMIGRGKAPTSHKIQQMQYYVFDNYDYISDVVMGTTTYRRFAFVALDQLSRPDINAMYYQPQDKLFIAKTGQTVEVIMNDSRTMLVNGAEITVPAANFAGLAGAVVVGANITRAPEGYILVRNIEPQNMILFTTSDAIFLGRTIYESQRIEAIPAQRDVVFDCNFVEHKEKVIVMTEDQKNLIKTQGVINDFNFQQKENLNEFKKDIDYTMLFGERAVDQKQSQRPTRHMRGLFNTIQTNVAFYDPATVTDMERLLADFMLEQAFRYNPNGTKTKVLLAGARLLYNFNLAFREYRQVDTLKITEEAGMDMHKYTIPGGHSLSIVRHEALRQNTMMENWGFAIDPSLMELRAVKEYNSRPYSNNDERDYKLMVEWQGSIAWHLEQAHALLRTA